MGWLLKRRVSFGQVAMACVIIHRLANWNEAAFVQFGYGFSQLYVELSKSKGQVGRAVTFIVLDLLRSAGFNLSSRSRLKTPPIQ
jgi:hypothetical protein